MTRSDLTIRTRLLVLALFAAVLGSGVLAGVAIERLRNPRLMNRPGVVGAAFLNAPARIPTELTDLDLTAAQQQTIKEILRGGQRRVASAFQQLVPQFAAIADSTDERVRAVLTDSQRARLGKGGRYRILKVMRDSSGRSRIDTLQQRRTP